QEPADEPRFEHVQHQRGFRRPPFVERRFSDPRLAGHLLDCQVPDRLLLEERVDGIEDLVVRRGHLTPRPSARLGLPLRFFRQRLLLFLRRSSIKLALRSVNSIEPSRPWSSITLRKGNCYEGLGGASGSFFDIGPRCEGNRPGRPGDSLRSWPGFKG